MKKIFIPVALVTLLASCEGEQTLGAKQQTGEVTSSVDADKDLPDDLKKELAETQRKIEAEEKKIAATLTTLEFDKVMHDFGEVKAETDVFTQFKVKNTGKRPLIIENVSASCGCTMPKKPEAPIAPGESDIIEVKFHSKPGQLNDVDKTITVIANTKEKTHLVKIHAFVVE